MPSYNELWGMQAYLETARYALKRASELAQRGPRTYNFGSHVERAQEAIDAAMRTSNMEIEDIIRRMDRERVA